MITAEALFLTYPDGTVALQNIDLQIDSGELVYIIGPSGSGKTSLIKLLLGAVYPTAGRLTVLGTTMGKNQAEQIRRLRCVIGPVFQEFKLIKGRTAMENVLLGMRFLDMPAAHRQASASDALSKVGLAGKGLSLVENMSWGECQRVAIARAVARKPRLILADEPTGNLDMDNARSILSLLNSCRDEGTTVIITTHATQLIDQSKADRLLEMKAGIMTGKRLG